MNDAGSSGFFKEIFSTFLGLYRESFLAYEAE